METTGSRSPVEWLLRQGGTDGFLPVSKLMTVDDDHWRAKIERIEVSPGMRVHLTTAEIKQALTVEPHQQEPEPWLLSHSALKGRVRLSLSDGISAELAPSRSLLFRAADRRASFSPSPGQTLRLVGFMVRDDRVRSIFGDDIPKAIRPLLKSGVETSAMLEVPVDARYRRLATTLFSNPLNGLLRSIYIEGTVLQLLAMQVAHAKSGSPKDAPSQRERAAIHAAHERLTGAMRHPPSSGVLAAEVGISEAKLNAGFRALYGGSVYEVLRNERLEHARIALETTRLPVKEIAFRIGYNHVTNFIGAFTARYGVSPGRYARRRTVCADKAPAAEPSG